MAVYSEGSQDLMSDLAQGGQGRGLQAREEGGDAVRGYLAGNMGCGPGADSDAR